MVVGGMRVVAMYCALRPQKLTYVSRGAAKEGAKEHFAGSRRSILLRVEGGEGNGEIDDHMPRPRVQQKRRGAGESAVCDGEKHAGDFSGVGSGGDRDGGSSSDYRNDDMHVVDDADDLIKVDWWHMLHCNK
jgi:hypothetical protein